MSDNILYTHLDNGIHHVKWLSVQRTAIYEYLDLLQGIVQEIPDTYTCRILHDYTDTETPSFTIVSEAMKNLSIPDYVTVRIAHIYNDSSYPMIIRNATMVARFNANRQFFKTGQEDEAIDWLLKDA